MENDDTPLRLLVKSHSNGLLDRAQYLEIRQQLLKKLATQGEISHEDIKNFLKIHQNTEQLHAWNSYSISDWIIIVLGLIAAATLGLLLYN